MLKSAPRDLLLDPKTKDLVVTTDFQFSRGIPGVIQAILIRFRMFQGEWFLNQTAGIPWFQDILGKRPAVAIAAAKTELRAALLAVEDVSEVLFLDVTYAGATRVMTVKWQVRTTFGDTGTLTTNLSAGV